jgi:hypothetical protein
MRSALYYPHTTIENEDLVKRALLLWDHLEFIVPRKDFRPEYPNRQIARAMELIGIPHYPDEDEKNETHERIEELISRRLPPQFYVSRYTNRPHSDDFFRIYFEKLLRKTWSLLEKANLSGKLLPSSDYPLRKFGGLLVMSILADSCAGTTRFRVTDRGDAYATLSGFLGNRPEGSKIKKSDAYAQLVPISLKVMDAPTMSLDSLIKMREREKKESGHSIRELRHRYVAGLETYVTKITTEKVRKTDAKEIQRQFADDMKIGPKKPPEGDWLLAQGGDPFEGSFCNRAHCRRNGRELGL